MVDQERDWEYGLPRLQRTLVRSSQVLVVPDDYRVLAQFAR